MWMLACSWFAGGLKSPAQVIHYALQMAQGLAQLYSKHVLHCDVKPHNVLIDSDHNVVGVFTYLPAWSFTRC
jgi:serine/threonine protein kinase